MRRDQVHEAMKGVVRVYARGFNENDVRSILDPRFVAPEEWVASGFFFRIKGDEGYILTNSHVVRNATQLEVMSILTSDELFRVEVVGLVTSLEPDIALLKMPEQEVRRFLKISKSKILPFLKVSSSDRVMRGQQIKAIGYPLGMAEPNISGGEITNFISGNDETMERLVTDAAINPGNSGGPAVTLDGWVVGINTAMVVPAENIGFITPIYLVETVLEELLKGGEARTSHLGATLQKNSANNADFLGMKNAEGVIVREVFKGSLADEIGLKPRDVITMINSCRVDRHGNVLFEKSFRKKNIYDILHSIPRSKEVVLKVFRAGRTITLKAKQVPWDRGYFPSQPIVSRRRFIYFSGFVIQELSDEIIAAISTLIEFDELRAYKDYFIKGCGLIVTHIGSGTLAEEMGLGLGELINQVNGKKIESLAELRALLEEEKACPFIIIDFSSGSFACIKTGALSKEEVIIQNLSVRPSSPT